MLRERIYLPTSPEYALPWLLGPAVSIALARFGLLVGKPTELSVTWKSTLAYAVAALAVAVMNALVLWTHVRTQFLTWDTARRRFFGTYAVLTAVYLLIFGLVLVQTGQASVSIRRASLSYTARCVLAGICSIFPALLVSALWKNEEPGVTAVRLQRALALDLLRRLPATRLSADDYRALVRVVETLPGTARAVQSQLIAQTDRDLSRCWADAAEEVQYALRNKSVDDYYLSAIRARLEPSVIAATAELERNR